jgi:hypothetical protein
MNVGGAWVPPRDMSNIVSLASVKTAWTDSTTSLLHKIVQVLRSFYAPLVNMERRESPWMILTADQKVVVGALIAGLMSRTSFAKPMDLKYGVEAWVNRIVLEEFGSESYGLVEKSEASLSVSPLSLISLQVNSNTFQHTTLH